MSKLHHPQSGLLLVRNNQQIMIPLEKGVTSLGRRQADIILDDPKASSSHAEIRKSGKNYKLIDLGSTNGTYLNRRKVDEVILSDQDVIEIGFTTLCFFEDLRDFHGEASRLSAAAQQKPASQEPPAATQVANVTTTSKTMTQASVELEVLEGDQKGKKFQFRKTHILVGREEGDLVLLDMDMSRKHLLIEVLSMKSIYIKDLGSTNGTHLNGERIESAKLKDGDLIKTGNTVFRFKMNREG